METRRSEVLGRAIAAHRHPSALTPAAIANPSGSLDWHFSKSQYLDFSILTRRFENAYATSVERYFDWDNIGDAREPMLWDTMNHAELDRYDDLEKPPGHEVAPKPRLSDRCEVSTAEVIELTGDGDDEAG